MKNIFFTLLLIIFLAVLMISCGERQIGNSSDTGNTGNTGDSGNTGETESDSDFTDDENDYDYDIYINPDKSINPIDLDVVDAENADTDSVDSIEMVSVPEGEFNMGCNEAVDIQCKDHENPYHVVTLSAYKIDKYEVTVGKYKKCVDSGLCNNNSVSKPHYNKTSDYSDCNLGVTGKENHPMNCVTWYGANAYCKWAGKRLATEAEWEKAARGTDGRKYPWGNEPEANCDYVVMDLYDEVTGEHNYGCGTGSTWPVGSKEAGKSPYGVYDMSGNVWGWVNDWYNSTYYETTPKSNPTGPEVGVYRVFRGGSWGYYYDGSSLRASSRRNMIPSGWLSSLGFRCAK